MGQFCTTPSEKYMRLGIFILTMFIALLVSAVAASADVLPRSRPLCSQVDVSATHLQPAGSVYQLQPTITTEELQ